MFSLIPRIILLTPHVISFGYHMSRASQMGAGNVPSGGSRRSPGSTSHCKRHYRSENCPATILTAS